MGKVFVLDEATINKIAAGEVIERPASIVKELAENSIDAGATAISIEIHEGGKTYINVSDNGCGILKEDSAHVFFRHATSKIKSLDDIQGIDTLGFRGEALASIAAVSEVELRTKAEEDNEGRLVTVKGGKFIENKDIGFPTGTSVTVRDLFFNTPARLKFLKSDISEQRAIIDIVERLALTNTGVSVKLTVNNKAVLHTPGNGDLLSVIHCVYGKNTAKEMLPLEFSNDLIRIDGYIGKPEIARGNSTYMTFSINKRYIKNKMMAEAMRQAYKTLLMNNRYPFTIINLSLKSDMIDVNVHPAKQEVKFSNDRAIFNILYMAVKDCLNENMLLSESPANFSKPNDICDLTSQNAYYETVPMFERIDIPSAGESFQNTLAEVPLKQKQHALTIRIIGQLFGTYILGEDENTFYLIDQHAAHERVLYEHIKEKYDTKSIAVQQLLMPIIIELSPAEKVLYAENSTVFEDLGFETEWFGESTIAVRAIPILMGEPCTGEFFGSMLDSLNDSSAGTVSPLENTILLMACKNSIKAGDRISPDEIRELTESLMKTERPYTCPHGRPTIITMSKHELEKKFKRIV